MARVIWLLALACRPGTAPSDGPVDDPVLDTWILPTADTAPTVPGPHNVLVLLTDDQGTDKIGVYGEHPDPPPTPRMDALAAEGVLFRNAWASPICSPSRAALLTGRLGRRNGMGVVVQILQGHELSLDEVLIPEMLQEASVPWSNAAIGKWHIGAFNAESGQQHPTLSGFSTFRGTMGNLYDRVEPDGLRHDYFHWEKITDGVGEKVDRYATSENVNDALELMASLPEPWFLYVAFNAPHRPFHAPPPELHSYGSLEGETGSVVLYNAMVEALDTEIGRLLDTMDPDQRARTTIVLAGDNGTPDHAITPPWNPKHGKDTPFEGGVNVPLIVTGPLVSRPGSESAALVHLVDVFATVADIAEVDLDKGSFAAVEIDGQSLAPLLRDPDLLGREVLFTEKYGPFGPPPYKTDWRISRNERFKVIERGGEVGVFDLLGATDDGVPVDVNTLGSDEQERVEALTTAHDTFWTELAGPP